MRLVIAAAVGTLTVALLGYHFVMSAQATPPPTQSAPMIFLVNPQTNSGQVFRLTPGLHFTITNWPGGPKGGTQPLVLIPNPQAGAPFTRRGGLRSGSNLPPPGVYQSSPYTCIVVVPDTHLDEGCLISPQGPQPFMPTLKPDVRLIPRAPKAEKSGGGSRPSSYPSSPPLSGPLSGPLSNHALDSTKAATKVATKVPITGIARAVPALAVAGAIPHTWPADMAMNATKKVRVLVVDDSATERRAFEVILGADPRLEVVGTAADAYVARDMILQLAPDVLTLDIQMPRMDGLSFLRVLQEHHPMPVVIVSSLTQEGSHLVLDAFGLGAVDVVAKESSITGRRDFFKELPDRIVAASRARVANCKPVAKDRLEVRRGPFRSRQGQPDLLLLGASTGGTEALRSVLTRLPAEVPGICIVQHFPATFSGPFARRLNDCCAFEVREAVDGEEIRPGLAVVAPGDLHLTLTQTGSRYRVHLNQNPPVHFVRPSVDVLFESAARCAQVSAVAVLLTGMGEDGAAGMRKLKDRGAATIAQDEQSCVVYGMPRAAVQLGAVDHVLPLDKIPEGILAALQPGSHTSLFTRRA